MAQDTAYQPVPYIYKSRGAVSRPELDRAPEYTYIQMLGCQERDEESMSSRYGQTIINRDAVGSGTSNYFFSSPITTISRLAFQSRAWRYAGLSDGTLWRREGNDQGEFTQISTGLSGLLFGSIVTNCYETSKPYLFIADSSKSIKDDGTFTSPELWGIDPPAQTANVLPYSPLLTMIDNFSSANTYTALGFDGSIPWAHGSITTLSSATSLGMVTDFPQFSVAPAGGSRSIPGGETYVLQSTTGESTNTTVYSGFTALTINGQASITVPVEVSDLIVDSIGTGYVVFSYSVDSGATWTNFLSVSGTAINSLAGQVFAVTCDVSDAANVQVQVSVRARSSSGAVSVDIQVGTITVTANAPGNLNGLVNGMLSNLGTPTLSSVPIASIQSVDFVGGEYTNLLITTSVDHGIASTTDVSIYGSTNNLVFGFYSATVTSTTTVKVPYKSVDALSATGGTLYYYSAGTPADCILIDIYSYPYPNQFSGLGFYQQVPTSQTSFPIGCWSGKVNTNSTASVSVTADFDLSQNGQVTSNDLIILTLKVSDPANISSIKLQFDVAGSGYSSSYYTATIAPAYYQGNLVNQISAYQSTENQILADALGLITGQPVGSTTAQLQPSNLSTGSNAWIAVLIPRGNFLPVGNAGQQGIDWGNVTGWKLIVETSATVISGDGSSTVACNGLYLQWGYGPSSFAGTGYDWRYTYYDADTGTESNASPIQTFSSQFGYLSSLTAPFYFRQAAQVAGIYSSDPQVTHVRQYRRGGIYGDNWRRTGQTPNITAGGTFFYKDVVDDVALSQANTLELNNDPPVTSSLVTPIQTTLSAATSGPGQSIYSTFNPQLITVVDSTAVFVPEQLVVVGNSNNLELVRVVSGGLGQFTAVLRLGHNAGEPVVANSIPRQKCSLCALAYEQVWLAGDPYNPHYLYYSKKGRPESFGPQNYIRVSSPDDPINAVINWRGTLIVGTLKTWYIIVGGANPYAQPTGSQHGIVARGGWTEVEGAVFYRASDGQREFSGADGAYKTQQIEWVYRDNENSLIPLADLSQQANDVMAYYQGEVYNSYVSQNSGARYRTVYNRNYQRFRYDDVPATAMFWEKDTNTLLIGKQVSTGNYALLQDQVYTQDYDDGGWLSGELVQDPINMTIQMPYRDLGKPHYPKQWNMLETDVFTNGMTMNTQILFDNGGSVTPITLATANTGSLRKKVQFTITGTPDQEDPSSGQQAYRASILHSFAVTQAPVLYQEDIYAAVLSSYMASYDTYWIKFSLDESKFIKEAYFDYTSPVAITVNLYADNNQTPYWTFTLPALSAPERSVQRVRFSNVNPGTTAFTCRTWRLIATSTDVTQPFQFWKKPRVKFKPIEAGSTFQIVELEV